jgi:NAD+ kinase
MRYHIVVGLLLLVVVHVASFVPHVLRTGGRDRSVAVKASDIESAPPPPQQEISRKEFTLACREDDNACGMYLNITEAGIAFFGPTSYSNQVAIKWEGGPAKVLVLVKPDEDIFPSVVKAIRHLWDRGIDVIVQEETYLHMKMKDSEDSRAESALSVLDLDQKQGIDMVMTFGGDGLLMHCNAMFGGRPIPPIMSFDFGSLGFLSPFEFENFESTVDSLIKNGMNVTLRMRLQCSIWRDDVQLGNTVHALNEVVIDRGPASFLSVLDITCDNRYMTTLQGDGIIIASPTGSTAYSLAAGGSMVHPTVPAILLTPICAHTLSFRPLLVPDSSVLEITVPEDCRASGWASFDGKRRQELQKGDMLRIQLCLYPMPTFQRADFTTDWFDALRSGFMFNERPRQSPKIPGKPAKS